MARDQTSHFRANEQTAHGPEAMQFPVFRMRVAEVFTGQNARVVRANLYNGSAIGKKDYFVRRAYGHTVGDSIFCVRPFGGTDAAYNGKSVEWLELPFLPPGARRWDGLFCVDDSETVAWTRPRYTDRT